MKDAGSALMGIGRATGENRALEAARQAVASPLLEINIAGAQGILFNITGSSNLTLWEVTEAAEEIRAAADPEANIIFGTSFNERLGEEVMITVIATASTAGAGPPRIAPRRPSASPRASPARRRLAAGDRRRPVQPRDFLEELERQRTDVVEPDATTPPVSNGTPAAPRSVGEPAPKRAPSYDADDLEIPSFLRRR